MQGNIRQRTWAGPSSLSIRGREREKDGARMKERERNRVWERNNKHDIASKGKNTTIKSHFQSFYDSQFPVKI